MNIIIIRTSWGYKIIGHREAHVYYHWKGNPFTRVVVDIVGSVYGKDHACFDGDDALKYAVKYAMGRVRVPGKVIFR